MWDHHLSSSPIPHDSEARAEIWELAMRKTDRDLRLADGTSHYPDWARILLGIDSLDQCLKHRINALGPLVSGHRHQETAHSRSIADEGAFAMGVMIAIQQDGNAATGPFQQLGIAGPPPAEVIIARIIEGREHWWDLAYLKALDLPPNEQESVVFAGQLVDARTKRLVDSTIKARAVFVALALGGLFFLPFTVISFMRVRNPGGYVGRWKLSFGLGVFLVAFLASIGFNEAINLVVGFTAARDDGFQLSMPVLITLKTLASLLPALIAMGLLFRRPRHAFSRFKLGGPIDGRLILGSFAIIQIVEFGLRMMIESTGPLDPTGGLSPEESGPWGLALGLVTACVVAPFAEEILFRGVLFRSLSNRLRLAVSVTLSSLVFALVHFYFLPSLVLVACVGATCALSYASSRSLLTAIVLHALYNASIKIPEWIVYQTSLS